MYGGCISLSKGVEVWGPTPGKYNKIEYNQEFRGIYNQR